MNPLAGLAAAGAAFALFRGLGSSSETHVLRAREDVDIFDGNVDAQLRRGDRMSCEEARQWAQELFDTVQTGQDELRHASKDLPEHLLPMARSVEKSMNDREARVDKVMSAIRRSCRRPIDSVPIAKISAKPAKSRVRHRIFK